MSIIKKTAHKLQQFFRKVVARPKIIVLSISLLVLGFGLGVVFQSLRTEEKDVKKDKVTVTEQQRTRGYDLAKERVNEALKEGKISKEQADKLLAKVEEVKQQTEKLNGKTSSEYRRELRQWLEENNLASKYLSPLY